ncbi:MAG: DUF3079 domain-containing protein [Rhodoferax sp.]|nr:DUF3079 domain-containing protein [Rhodoferax sp.]
MSKIFPIHPANPHRICWGCDKYCSVDAMACANERSPHPAELFGDDWLAWGDQQLESLDKKDVELWQTREAGLL